MPAQSDIAGRSLHGSIAWERGGIAPARSSLSGSSIADVSRYLIAWRFGGLVQTVQCKVLSGSNIKTIIYFQR
jgi:hypothetical protein